MATLIPNLTPEILSFLRAVLYEKDSESGTGPYRKLAEEKGLHLELVVAATNAACLGLFDWKDTPEGYPPAKVDWPFGEVSVQELLDSLVPELKKSRQLMRNEAKRQSERSPDGA